MSVEMPKTKHEFFALDYTNLRPYVDLLKKRTNVRDENGARQEIYYGTEITEEEQKVIEKFESILTERGSWQNRPNSWTNDDSLRMISTREGDATAAADQFEKQLEWLESLKKFTLTDLAASFLLNGNVYLGGRDKEGYPSLWVFFGDVKIDATSTADLASAMTFAALVCKKFMMVPHYLDKFNVIFDVNNRGPTSLPMKYLPEIMTLFKDNFNGFNCRSLILNPPFSFSMAWALVKKMIPTRTQKKFVILKAKETSRLLEFFDKSQLEEKWLGTEPNYEQGKFWPPKVFDCSKYEGQILDETQPENSEIVLFNLWSKESDSLYLFDTKFWVEAEAEEDSDSMEVEYETLEDGQQMDAGQEMMDGLEKAPAPVEKVVNAEPETKQMTNGLYAGIVLAVSTLLMSVYFMVSETGGAVVEQRIRWSLVKADYSL